MVGAGNFDAYLAAVDLEAERALVRYGMLVVPGLELTYNDLDPNKAAHAVAVGLRAFVPLETGIFEALARRARPEPRSSPPIRTAQRPTRSRSTRPCASWRRWDCFAPHLDRVSSSTRRTSTAGSRPSVLVAGGDFHRLEHLSPGNPLALPAERGSRGRLPALPRARLPTPSAPRPPSRPPPDPAAAAERPCAASGCTDDGPFDSARGLDPLNPSAGRRPRRPRFAIRAAVYPIPGPVARSRSTTWPALILDIELRIGEAVTTPVPPEFQGFAYLLEGEGVRRQQAPAKPAQLSSSVAVMSSRVTDASPGTLSLLMAGQPYGEVAPSSTDKYVD